eukprot:gene13502-18116_t
MGNGALKKRYLGGKSVYKYFYEDLWPINEELFYKLHLNEAKAIELFKAFSQIDKNENQVVDVDEIFQYLGGKRTKFTDRIFYHEELVDGELVEGLNYREFTIMLWNYCTFTPYNLGRYLFEIFDIDNQKILEKSEVETMYCMMYDCEECDEIYINTFPYHQKIISIPTASDTNNQPYYYHRHHHNTATIPTKTNDENNSIQITKLMIHKEDFILFCIQNDKQTLIQPAIDYQARIRKKLGGTKLWETVTNLRIMDYKIVDDQNETLQLSLSTIINNNDIRIFVNKQIKAEELLKTKKKLIEEKAEYAEREFRLLEEEKETTRMLNEELAPDKPMKQAWKEFEDKYNEFVSTEYTTEDIWQRREDRSDLYNLFDRAVAISSDYFIWKDNHDTEITE